MPGFCCWISFMTGCSWLEHPPEDATAYISDWIIIKNKQLTREENLAWSIIKIVQRTIAGCLWELSIDNANDRTKVRNCDCGRDEFLRLCNIWNKSHILRQAICSILHKFGIKEPIKMRESVILVSFHIRRHLAALHLGNNHLLYYQTASHEMIVRVLHTCF